jgi:hypothetical protein
MIPFPFLGVSTRLNNRRLAACRVVELFYFLWRGLDSLEVSELENNPQIVSVSLDSLVASPVAGGWSKLLALPLASRLLIPPSKSAFVPRKALVSVFVVVDITVRCANP